MSEPRTAAGRALLAGQRGTWHPMNDEFLRDHVLAIEAEAAQSADGLRAALISEIETRIRSGAYLTYHAGPRNLAIDAVDAALSAELPATPDTNEQEQEMFSKDDPGPLGLQLTDETREH